MFTGQLWKGATAGATVIAVVLIGLLISSYFVNRDISRQRDALSAQINDPTTGYVAQLAQARTNVETLKVEVQRQNAAIDQLSQDSQRRLAEAERRLAAAQAYATRVERQLAGFLATGPSGATLEDRVRDIDERAMKEFLP